MIPAASRTHGFSPYLQRMASTVPSVLTSRVNPWGCWTKSFSPWLRLHGHHPKWMPKRNMSTFYTMMPKPKKVGIIGGAFRGGQMRLGVEEGPAAIRQGGFLEAAIKLLGHEVRNYDDLRIEGVPEIDPQVPGSRMHRVHLVGSFNREFSRRVEESVYENDLTIILGGDHSISMGSVHGHARASTQNLCVIWMDAHSDINTPTSSTTKNGHGMVMSFLCRETRDFIDDQLDGLGPLAWLQPPISCKRLGYVGLRDVEPWERVALDALNIVNYDMQDVDDIGVKECIRQMLLRINPQLKYPIHLSFDVDSLCPEYGPSTGLPVAGGLTLREAVMVTEVLAATGRLRCLDVTELNPKIGTTDDVKKTAEAAHAVILAACGNLRGGISREGETSLPYPAPRNKKDSYS